MKLIPVGRVVAAHGLKGEVKLRYYDETAMDLPRYPSFFVDRAGTPVALRPSRVRRQGNTFIVKFKGFETVEDVAFLCRRQLFIAEGDLPALGEGEYYDYQLIGLKAVTEEGNTLGKVVDVMHTGGADILVVKGSRELLVPLAEEHIMEIRREEGFVKVREKALVE
jgi:16S rRNA processing protein RimM